MKLRDKLEADLEQYRAWYQRGEKRSDRRLMEGAQQNIDKTLDALHKIKEVRLGSSIKVLDRAYKESWYTVESIRGDIALMNKNGSIAMTRVRSDFNTFVVNGITYQIKD